MNSFIAQELYSAFALVYLASFQSSDSDVITYLGVTGIAGDFKMNNCIGMISG